MNLLRRLGLADPVLAALCVFGGFLLFWNLGGRGLWQDEAETALLAQRVLTYGVPLADDGFNIISNAGGKDHDARGVYNITPWVQFYVEAASLKAFGSNETAARLPFALAGWLCLPLAFLLALRWFDSAGAARFGVLSLVLSTPFLLHARQARYYTLAQAALLVLLIALEALPRKSRWAPALFAAAGLFLFYTNYFIAVGLLAAAWAAAPLLRPAKVFWKNLALATGVIALGAAPGMIYHNLLGRGGGWGGAQTVMLFLHMNLVWLFCWLLPWPVAGGLLLAAARGGLRASASRRVYFLSAWTMLFVAYLAVAPICWFRYLCVLAPALAVLIGLALEQLKRRAPWLALSAAALLTTNVFVLMPLGLAGVKGTQVADPGPRLGALSFPFFGFIYELTHTYDSCDRAAALYIKTRASPGDVVLTNYGVAPLQYYTGLKTIGGYQGVPLPDKPDWIVARGFFDTTPGEPMWGAIWARAGPRAYSLEPLICPDPPVADIAEPALHFFRRPGPDQARSIMVFHRISKPGISH
jgi:4-amino-4-deoxy-L-arabinose transferase-like glycosyltransferase